jgi:hypothetical protein
MYTMQVVASSVFHTMLFPHNGKIVTIDQLTHHEPNQSGHIDNILPLIHSSTDLVPMIDVRPGIFQDPSLIGTYQGFPHPNPTTVIVCIVTTDGVEIPDPPSIENSSDSTTTPSHPTPILPNNSPYRLLRTKHQRVHHPWVKSPFWKIVPQAITQIPFFYPPPGVTTYQVVATLTLPNMVITIPVWYLEPPAMVPGLSLPPQPAVPLPRSVAHPSTHPTGHTVGGNITTTGDYLWNRGHCHKPMRHTQK